MTSKVIVRRGDNSAHKTRLRVQDFDSRTKEWKDAGILLAVETDGPEVDQYITDTRRLVIEEYKE